VAKRSNRRKKTNTRTRRPAPEPENEDVARGRPGRRSVEDRTQAVLDLLSGKATVEQISRRLGVQRATVEKWRDLALEGVAGSLRVGTGKTERERELEKELKTLETAFTRLAIKHEIAERELGRRPTRPGR
jgi:transposase-like protein